MPPCPGRIRSTLTPRLVEYHSLCCLLTVRIWQENVPDKTFKLTGGRQELPQRATGGAESQEFFGGQPVIVVRAAKVRQLGVQLRDDIGVDRLVYARHRFDPTLVQPDLPAERRRDYDVSADQLAPVHMIAERRRKQPRAKSLLPVDGIRFLEHGDPRPLQVPGVEGERLALDHDLQPIVETADHQGADRAHRGDIESFSLPPPQPPFHRVTHCQRLCEGERDRGVDADASVGNILDGFDARSYGGDLHDDVRREPGELHGLLHDGPWVAVQPWIGLDGEPAVAAGVLREDRLEQTGSFYGEFPDHLPADCRLARSRLGGGAVSYALLPSRQVRP